MDPHDLHDLHRGLDLVLAQHPGGRRLRVAGPLVELTGGWASTAVCACDLTSTDPDGASIAQAVLKVYAADDAGAQHAVRERRALQLLATTAVRVPAVLLSDAGPNPLGRPYLLMERVAGASFWAAHEAARDDGARAELVRSFVQPLVALHHLDPSPLDPSADRMRGYGAVDAELAGLRLDVAAFPGTGLPEVVGWLQERRDELPCQRPVVLHRDHHPWNTIRDDDGSVWVLDWDWRIGDARFDLAWTCTLMQRSGQDAFSAAVREEYVRQSGEVDRIEHFEVLTTVRWLLDVLPALGARSALGPAKREDFRAFLVEPLRRARRLLQERTGMDVRLPG